MQLNKSVTVGNLVSWALIVAASGVAWGNLASASAQHDKDIEKLQGEREEIVAIADKVNKISTDVALANARLQYTNEKLDELSKRIK